jgi:hypothetical protein
MKKQGTRKSAKGTAEITANVVSLALKQSERVSKSRQVIKLVMLHSDRLKFYNSFVYT